MIPHRLTLKNFLCYAEEQVYDFEGAPLWVLAGPNGSGKSAVFDGMTYALFAAHRLGEQRFKELIHRGKDRLEVSFEFSVGTRRYRIRRSYGKRGQPTQQVWACTGDPQRDLDWDAVPETSSVDGANGWVERELGLTYKTFTSSVLLLQGGAEKLIGGKPKERFEVMQGIVDVERYQRLHERIVEAKRGHAEERRARQIQFQGIPEVTAAQVEEAVAGVGTARTALEIAEGEVERWQGFVVQARRWAELTTEASQLRGQVRSQEERLADAVSIEADWQRFQHLREVLGPLRTACDFRLRLERCRGKQADLGKRRAGFASDLTGRTAALEQCEQKRDSRQGSLQTREKRAGELALQRRELKTILGQVQALDQLRQELRELDTTLAEFSDDLPSQCAGAQAELEALSALREGVPSLRRLCEERTALRGALGRAEAARGLERSASDGCVRLRPALDAVELDRAAAAETERRAGETVASAEALFDQAVEKFSSFAQLSGEETCSACGQRLTPDHIETERGRLEAQQRETEQALTEARAAQVRAKETLAALTTRRQRAADDFASAQEEEGRQRLVRTQAEKDATRHTNACATAYSDLADGFRALVAAATPDDWLQTTYPTEDDIASATGRLGGEAQARRHLQALQGECQLLSRLQTERKTKAALLGRQEATVPADASALEAQDRALAEEEAALAPLIRSDEEAVREAKADIERLGGECRALGGQITDTDLRLKGEETRAEEYARGVETARGALPEAVRSLADRIDAAALEELEEEWRELTEGGAESRHQELARARLQLEPLRIQLRACESSQEAIPPQARCAVADAEAMLQRTKGQQTDAGTGLRTAEHQRDQLVRFQAQRGEAEAAYRSADRQHHLCGLLADLLSREGLQLHLVRQAERAIVDVANEILDRLSGGDLSLNLREAKEMGGEALHLTARYRPVSTEHYDLALLSGSQRFRVAVSLALAIGQYASRQQRPLQSVIIDEGFGCLDRVGRQGMIQELLNLKDYLSKTVLVSHLEEFAESFSDGYLLELQGGATRAAPFHRA